MTKKLFIIILATVLTGQSSFAETKNVEDTIAQAQNKLNRALLERELAEIRDRMMVLEDLADPGVISIYREYKGVAGASMVLLPLVLRMYFRPTLEIIKGDKYVVGATALISLFTILNITSSATYMKIKTQYEKLSREERLAEYKELTILLQKDLQLLDHQLQIEQGQ